MGNTCASACKVAPLNSTRSRKLDKKIFLICQNLSSETFFI